MAESPPQLVMGWDGPQKVFENYMWDSVWHIQVCCYIDIFLEDPLELLRWIARAFRAHSKTKVPW